MNVTVAAEKNTGSVFAKLSRNLVADKTRSSLVLWTNCAAVLFLLNLLIAFLNPCFFTKYLPAIVLPLGFATVIFRIWGLSISYVALFLLIVFFPDSFPESGRLWQMGVLFSSALNFFILLLSVEESEACFEGIKRESAELQAHALDLESQIQSAAVRSEKIEKQFQEEIEQLKAEAALKTLERNQQLKQYELVLSEIELLSSQKDQFIEESQKARSQAALHLQLLNEHESKIGEKESRWIAELEEYKKQKALIIQEWEEAQNLAAERLQLVEELRSQLATLSDQKSLSAQEWEETQSLAKERLSQVEELRAQLVTLRDQKALGLLELEEARKRVADLRAEAVQKEIQFAEVQGAASHYRKLLETNQLEYEQTVEALKANLIVSQEAILALQTQPVFDDNSEELTQLKQALASSEGMNKQLRSQFNEKSQTLSKTREELFQVQGQVTVLEKEREYPNLDMINALEKSSSILAEELEQKNEEITHLEELICEILSNTPSVQ